MLPNFRIPSWFNKVIAIRRLKQRTNGPTLSAYCDGSSGRRTLEHTITALTVASPVVGAVPIAGTPMRAAIDSLLEILKIIDVSATIHGMLHDGDCDFQQVGQSEEEIAEVKAELYRLSSQISAISVAKSSSVAALRDDLTK